MEQSGALAQVGQILEGRFTHSELATEAGRGDRTTSRRDGGEGADQGPVLTLSRAVSEVHGVGRDVGGIAFTNWREVRSSLSSTWSRLDEVLTADVGRRSSAAAWSTDEARTEAEVLDLVGRAASDAPDLPPVVARGLRSSCRISSTPTTRRRHVLAHALQLASEEHGPGPLARILDDAGVSDLRTVNDWDLLAMLDDASPDPTAAVQTDGPGAQMWSEFRELWATKSYPVAGWQGWSDRRCGSLLAHVLGDDPMQVDDQAFRSAIRRNLKQAAEAAVAQAEYDERLKALAAGS